MNSPQLNLQPPPIPPPPLPSFAPLPSLSSLPSASIVSHQGTQVQAPSATLARDEEQPERGADYDLLSGWARSLSVSPRLFPTSFNPSGSSNGMSMDPYRAGSGSYRGLGEGSAMLGVRKDLGNHGGMLSVGMGLSPLLGPSQCVPTVRGSPMLNPAGVGYDYSQFGQFHTSLPPSSSSSSLADPLHAHNNRLPYAFSPRSHPLSQRHHSGGSAVAGSPTGGGGSTHSFSNVEKLRSMSPQSPLPPPLIQQEDPDNSHRRYSDAAIKPQHESSTLNSSMTPAPPLNQQHPDATDMNRIRAAEEEEDARIRAYAKLEFPTFDIYIQKLSVIVGRRPAVAAAPSPAFPAAGSLPVPNQTSAQAMERSLSSPAFGAQGSEGRDAKSESVKLEDFVMGMADGEIGVVDHGAENLSVVKEEVGEADESAQRKQREEEEEREREYVAKIEKDRIEFSDFLKSSPSLGPVVTVKDVDADLTSLVLDPAPAASTSAVPLPTSPSLNAIPVLSDKPATNDSLHPATSPKVLAQPSPPAPPTIITDIDLGPIRAVSRQHARLYFDYEMGGWALEVLGRNGVVVEGRWKAKGEKEALGRRTKIQIAERIFYFVLPTIDPVVENSASATPAALGGVTAPGSPGDSDLSSTGSSSSEEDDVANASADSSSLSEISDSDIELSPILQPVASTSAATTTGTSKSKKRAKPTRAIAWDSDVRPHPHASSSTLLALAPPPRAASKNIVYSAGGGSSRRNESPQTTKSGVGKSKGARGTAKGAGSSKVSKSAGKGKGKGSGGLGKGYGKGKTTLPSKKPRRPSSASLDDDDGGYGGYGDLGYNDADEEGQQYYDEPLPEKKIAAGESSPRKKAASKQPVPKKAPKKKVLLRIPATQPNPPLSVPTPDPVASVSAPPSEQPTVGSTTPSNDTNPPLPPLPGSTTAAGSTSNGPQPNNLPPHSETSGQHHSTGSKRGRGRPPKNGVSAQRPKRTQIDDTMEIDELKPIDHSNSLLPPLPHYGSPPKTAAPLPVQSDVMPLDPALGGVELPSAQPSASTSASAVDQTGKPPYTYASLIAQAISSCAEKKMTLNGIYDWITAKWPYFSDNQNGWQNSIRHNLTLSRGFLKIARQPNEAGKGAFWAIDPEQVANFDGLNFRKKNISKVPKVVAAKPAKAGPPLPPPKPRPVAPIKAPATRPPVPSLADPLPIIVAPIPASYVRPTPPPSATPPDELTAALLRDPPIVLHEGRLILNPSIFAHLNKGQLDNLQLLPASQALQILQAFVVQHFKEKMRKAAAAAASGGAPPGPRPIGSLLAAGSTAPRPIGPLIPPGTRPATLPVGVPRPVASVPSAPRPVVPTPPTATPSSATSLGKRKIDDSTAGRSAPKIAKVGTSSSVGA